MSEWLSKRAVLWALDRAPDVPARLVSTLVAVARYAGEDGRGAHPSALTVAAHTRKTERQAKRDLAELAGRGLLLPGDPRIVAAIRADRRPNVYDLPISRGDTHDTPYEGDGVTPRAARGDIQSPNGVSPVSPEEVLKTSRTGARDGAKAPPSLRPQTLHLAPPCPACGKAFSQEQLAEPEFREMALAGEVLHPDCTESGPCRPCAEGKHSDCDDVFGDYCPCKLKGHGPADLHACRQCAEWASEWDPATGLCGTCRAAAVTP